MTAKFEPLSMESGPLEKHSGQVHDVPINRSRRRLVNGVASGAGVLLSVHAKTALGTTVCQSPSAAISGNTSPRPGGPSSCTGGRSPGFWKVPQHFNSWIGVTPAKFKPTCNIQPCSSGLRGVKLTDISPAPGGQGTPVTTILAGAPTVFGSISYGVWAIIAFPTSFTNGQLMRHLLCAYLNASLWPADYPITKAQVQAMWLAVKGGGTYCPSSLSCGNNGWTAAQVISYIEGLYDFNELEVDLCTPP